MLAKVAINNNGVFRDFHYRSGSSDQATIAQVFVDRHYELSGLRCYPEIRRFIEAGVRSGRRPLIVDAGANIGAASVFFAFSVPGCAIAAIEPDPGNHALLVRNTADLDVRTFLAGVASRPGRLRVTNELGQFDSFRTQPASEDEAGDGCVPAVTIPEILDGFGGGFFPLVAKIDIEGGEKDLFSDNIGWAETFPIVVVELHDWLLPRRNIAQPFLRWVAAGGRDFVIRGENVFAIAHWIVDSHA